MEKLTSKERFQRMFLHQEADRIPIIDDPWAGTIRRWQREGMPKDIDWRDYFGIDKVAKFDIDTSPRYQSLVLEEDDKQITYTTSYGVTLRKLKEEDSSPEFLDYTVDNSKIWFEETKKRMLEGENRINWKRIEENYPLWQKEGYWIQAGFWFGFDVTHSWMSGTETILIALLEEPEWVMDMFDTYLNSCIKHFDILWDKGYRFDSIFWYDDMGYKNNTFFSLETYREVVKPFHKKAIDWAHNKGIYAHLHSCGNIMPFVDDLVNIGLDGLNPLEIKAGMDPIFLKEKYKDKLLLHGGLNAVLWDDSKAVIQAIEENIPKLKENGGYIFSSDHSIPNSVSLDNFKKIVETVKRVGSY